MTQDLFSIVAQYRAGLEAEIALLHQLADLSTQQRAATLASDYAALPPINDARDGTMASLVTIEHQLKPLRQQLVDQSEQLAHRAEFQDVMRFHKQAAALVTTIAETDGESMEALKLAEVARRESAAAMEKGETTLAAYRRVVAPTVSHASLVNRRG
jgi:hypothetical protein